MGAPDFIGAHYDIANAPAVLEQADKLARKAGQSDFGKPVTDNKEKG